jgi:hypothetical protein
MKTFIAIFVVICVGVTGGIIFYLDRQKAASPAVAPVTESSPKPPASVPAEPPPLVSRAVVEPVPAVVKKVEPEVARPAKPTVAHSRAVDTLVSAQTSITDRQALLKKLKGLGELDAAIAELKQRVAEAPGDATIPIALGEAIMDKFPVQNFNDASALGLQIDQNFDAALKVDPNNWEAQYYKADSMSYWPDVAGKGPEVIQRLSSLIDQQDTMTPRPEFAQTYVLLGDQYQKAGQSDYATTTWKLGLTKFPNDVALQAKNAGQ